MEKAKIIREIEETEQEEEEIEDLQARRSTKLPNNLNPNYIKEDDDNDDYKQHKSANTNGEVEDDVHLIPTSIQELKTIDNGGIDVSEAELYQQVDFDNSEKCINSLLNYRYIYTRIVPYLWTVWGKEEAICVEYYTFIQITFFF